MRHSDGTRCAGETCAFKNDGGHTSKPAPRYGSPHVIPDEATAAWGAWLIIDQLGHVELVWDRQGADGPLLERAQFLLLLEERFPGDKLTDAIAWLLQLGPAEGMSTRDAEDFILYQDDDMVVHANTNASAGYCYVTAWTAPRGEQRGGEQ